MKRRSQAGQTLVLAAFSLTILMLAAGLAIDMGYLRYQRRRMQAAADSAAIAGAAELTYGDMTSAAISDAAGNGFTNGTLPNGNQSIQVYCLSTITGAANSASACPSNTPSQQTPFVEVTISEQEPLFFMRIIPGISLPVISATAIAQLGSGPGCMYALGSGGIVAGGLSAGAMDLEAEYCTVISDGSLTLANGIVKIVNAEGIGYVGSYDGGTQHVSPAPQQIANSGDPLAYLQSQMAPSATVGSCSAATSGITCQPGDYPSGITITALSATNPINVSVQFSSDPSTGTVTNLPGGSLNVSFSPGYYSLGGNLTIVGNAIDNSQTEQAAVINGMVTGYGVTFYAYGTASLAINAGVNSKGIYTADYALSCTGSPFGNNTFDHSGFYVGEQVQFSAPSDSSNGGVAGVVYMQNPGDPSPSWVTLANGDGMDSQGVWDTNGCNGPYGTPSTTSYMWGAIYSPGSTLNLDGIGIESITATNMCSTLPRFTEIVANVLNPTNNINMGVDDCASPPTQFQATVYNPASATTPNPVIPALIKAAALVD